jgi:hypothetical protein
MIGSREAEKLRSRGEGEQGRGEAGEKLLTSDF